MALRFAIPVVLLAGLSHAQALAPLPPEPVIEPAPASTGWRDGSAVPAGAGLVTPMTPMGEPLNAPRSPNRRLLPATKEPGVWAADGSAPDPAPPELLGLALPLRGMDGWEGSRRTQLCGDSMEGLVERLGLRPRAMALPDSVRNCLAAQLFRLCALAYEASYQESARSDPSKQGTYRLYQRMVSLADAWLDTACAKSPRSVEAEAIFSQVAGHRLKDRPGRPNP